VRAQGFVVLSPALDDDPRLGEARAHVDERRRSARVVDDQLPAAGAALWKPMPMQLTAALRAVVSSDLAILCWRAIAGNHPPPRHARLDDPQILRIRMRQSCSRDPRGTCARIERGSDQAGRHILNWMWRSNGNSGRTVSGKLRQ
jgi:hypothetical protein